MEKFSDVDCIDEEESSINKLCGNRLLASAFLELKRLGKAGIVSADESHTDPQDSLAEIQVAKFTNTEKPKIRLEEEEDKNEAANKDQPPQKKVQYVKSWRYKDIQDTNGLSEWELPGATRDIYDSPTALF